VVIHSALPLSNERGEAVGGVVGYQVRFDTRVSAATRIRFVTEGILTRRLQGDPALEGIDALIFDIGMAIIGFGYRDEKLNLDQIGALLAGYRCQRQLSRAEQESLPAMARWCAHGLGFWHLRCYLDRPNDRQHQRIHEIQRMVRGLRGDDADTIRAAFEH